MPVKHSIEIIDAEKHKESALPAPSFRGLLPRRLTGHGGDSESEHLAVKTLERMGDKLLLKNCLPPRVKEVFAAVDQQAAWEAWRLHAKHKQTANIRADEGNPGCTADSGPGRAAPGLAWAGLRASVQLPEQRSPLRHQPRAQ